MGTRYNETIGRTHYATHNGGFILLVLEDFPCAHLLQVFIDGIDFHGDGKVSRVVISGVCGLLEASTITRCSVAPAKRRAVEDIRPTANLWEALARIPFCFIRGVVAQAQRLIRHRLYSHFYSVASHSIK